MFKLTPIVVLLYFATRALAAPNPIVSNWFAPKIAPGHDSIAPASNATNGTGLTTVLTELPPNGPFVSALKAPDATALYAPPTIYLWLIYNRTWIADLWVPFDDEWHQVVNLPCLNIDAGEHVLSDHLYRCNRIPWYWLAYRGGAYPDCTVQDHMGLNYTLSPRTGHLDYGLQQWGMGYLVQACCGQTCKQDPEAQSSGSVSF